MNEAEQFLLDFHRRFPGCTRVAFSAGKTSETGESSYELLSSLADAGTVLDLGCGDGHLLSLLSPATASFGLDFSKHELAEARERAPRATLARGRAQELPFGSQTFDLVLSHFAFHLMSPLDEVVAEIARVLKPGGRFAAIIGGGPKVGDCFEQFLDLMLASRAKDQRIPSIGERRGRTTEGLAELFGTHPEFSPLEVTHQYVDFGGSFDEVWERLSTIYDLMPMEEAQTAKLREDFRSLLGPESLVHIPCTMAIRRMICVKA